MITREEKNENWFRRNFSFDNHQQLPPMEANDGEAHATLLANNVVASFGCNFLFFIKGISNHHSSYQQSQPTYRMDLLPIIVDIHP
jgi:hypothetical protein